MPATAHLSYWLETAGDATRNYPTLDRDMDVDVAILGGGITGLTSAAHLVGTGRKVAVLEANQIGSGTTGFTSAHLDATTDLPLDEMILDFGQSTAMAVTTATREAIDQIEARCRQWPECEFARLASYEFAESADGLDRLHKQCAAERKLGFNCWFTRQAPLPFSVVGAVHTASQARFHSQRYIQHLAADLHSRGCSIFEHTTSPPPRGSAPLTLETDGGRVHAKSVIVATHSPYLGISEFDFRVFPYQSYVIAARVQEEIPDALYWDVARPYHYLRLASPDDPQLLLIGGADHKTGQPLDERERFEALIQYAEDHFHVTSIEHQWSAELYDPADGLPHVGRVPGQANVYIATGFAGTGLTWGTVAGTLMARMILGQRHPLDEILSPGRLTVLASAKDVIAENLDVMRRFVADRFAPSKTISDRELQPGSGEVIKENGKLVAICRDSEGLIHRLSPYCTHAGCVVHWNQAEETWDCPCHGGRFRADGRRFYGPPTKGLEAMDGGAEPHE